MKAYNKIFIAGVLIFFSACGGGNGDYDASGVFETVNNNPKVPH